ncbi:MAG TPA: TolC family protein [Thermoanaerobaculia bacterium]
MRNEWKGMWLALALIALLPAGTAAQEAALPLSLDDALERALEESEEVRLASARVDAASARTQNAWSNALPQLNTQLGYTKTLKSVFQTAGDIQIPDSMRFNPDPNAPLDERVTYLEDHTGAAAFESLAAVFSELPFGNENTWVAGLSASQPIFAGGRIRSSIQAAEHAEAAALAASDEASADSVLQVRQAYYDAALAAATVTIVEASVVLAQRHLEDVRLREDAGRASELELLRAEVEAENLQPQLVQARNGRELALLNLKRLVNLPANAAVELTTPLVPAEGEDAAVPTQTLPDLDEVQEQLSRRAALRAAESQVAAAQEGVDIARSAWLPTVALSANLSRQAFPDETFTFPGGGDWNDDWTVGVMAQWPLFQGFRRNAQIDEAQAVVQEAELGLEQLRESFAIEYQQAQGELERARAQLGAAQRTAQQALRVYELTEMRFREGLATQLEVDNARLALQQARLNEVQAYHDAWVAIARAERALGTTDVPRP